ncbi:TagK domain-containing protein [Paraburkholderia fungorum]|uniref:TagK domain-containing protein n=1 Tax=Paraburkholderia fungorum TaxID=134537 RepID=UPI0038BDBDD4
MTAFFRNDESEQQEHSTVFAVIGMPAAVGSTSIRAGEEAAHDLIEALYQQYRRMLDDPQISLGGDWAMQAKPFTDPVSSGRDEALSVTPGDLSIEALLSGVRHLEDEFGPLQRGALADMADTDPVPEILHLFAPAEYQSAAVRRAPPIPPGLALREHHAPGIDSPLSIPRTSTRGAQ